ncbi:hypothetical protein NOR_02570 [Metarhizium rileyi]|uniref:Uncharacterized protein n=1 Tax=Metarhizium rileyi (strain RCEF 4871) TaxID=1649241 RepID=A0A167GQ54_METRR|nr:hypothetical protein NOR_02570 [Metarhizium rileyi RCEF 4871]TWU75268.1 hypothetical protein ED733_006073 [Metarhizium rileyi]
MLVANNEARPDLVRSLQVSANEMLDFYQSHFSPDAVANFGSDFINVTEKQEADEYLTSDAWMNEADGLGYYEDGVKRTLTDEQIDIFRHSELRELQRQHDRANLSTNSTLNIDKNGENQAYSTEHQSAAKPATRSSKKRKKKGRLDKQEKPKPDLRKRTWDVVDAGLDSLDYD